MNKNVKLTILKSILVIYLFACGYLLFQGTKAMLPPKNQSYGVLISRYSRDIINNAGLSRKEVPKDAREEYDAKLGELKEVFAELKGLYSGKMSLLDKSIGGAGFFSVILYLCAAVGVIFGSSYAMKCVNYANGGFLLFLALITMNYFLNVFSRFNKACELIDELSVMLSQGEAAFSGGMAAFYPILAGGGSIVLVIVVYIFIPRFMITRPLVTEDLKSKGKDTP